MQHEDCTSLACEYVLKGTLLAWNVAAAFVGLGCYREQDQSKYISNGTVQASISK